MVLQFDLYFPEPKDGPHIVLYSQGTKRYWRNLFFDVAQKYIDSQQYLRGGWSKILQLSIECAKEKYCKIEVFLYRFQRSEPAAYLSFTSTNWKWIKLDEKLLEQSPRQILEEIFVL